MVLFFTFIPDIVWRAVALILGTVVLMLLHFYWHPYASVTVQLFTSASSVLLMLLAICNLAVVALTGQLGDGSDSESADAVAAFHRIALALLVIPAAVVLAAHAAALPQATREARTWVEKMRGRWAAWRRARAAGDAVELTSTTSQATL
jgi:phosphoglycerol transferase MdoB-like AlkP superfamily enzyme